MSQNRKRAPESAMFFNMTRPPEAVPAPQAQPRSTPSTPSSASSPVSTRSVLLQSLGVEAYSVPALVKRISRDSQGYLSLRLDEVHWKLREMEREGLVEGVHEPHTRTVQRAPLCYRLTSKGLDLADQERQAICGLFGLLQPVDVSSAH